MKCEDERRYRLELYMKLCQLHIEEITQHALTVPAEKREVYRALYKKRQRQYHAAKEALEPVLI